MFALALLRHVAILLRKPLLTLRATYAAGVLSLPIILVAGLFVGMVLSFQAYTTMVRFGAEQALGTMVALSLLRELGPVVSALLFAGRAGSAITAEIGLMKTTEQLVAMEMMGYRAGGTGWCAALFGRLVRAAAVDDSFCCRRHHWRASGRGGLSWPG